MCCAPSLCQFLDWQEINTGVYYYVFGELELSFRLAKRGLMSVFENASHLSTLFQSEE